MAELTLELLDALLSPTQNAKAEEYYQSIPLIRRISSLVQLLQGLQLTTPQDSTNGSSSFQSQSMLACVLLRRNIQSLGGAIAINDTVAVEGLANVGQAVDLCKGVVEALLTMWGQGTWNKPVKRQMGFVLAEATSTLLLMDEGTSGDVVNLILGNIAPAVSHYFCLFVWRHGVLLLILFMDFLSLVVFVKYSVPMEIKSRFNYSLL
jgi:hypothetical protein